VKVTTERTPDCQAIVNVEVDDEQLKRATEAAARRISRVRPIPGFRPGKAPVATVERTVGKDALREEAVEELAQSLYKQVLKDEKIDAYDAGKLDIAQKEPLVLKFTVPTRPEVKLGDYQSVHMRPKEVTATDEEVDQVLQRYQMDQAEMTPVTRPVQMGDLVTVDVNGGIEGQATNENKGLQVRMESEKPIFPWLDQLVGMNPNETRTITYRYPDDDANPNLAGKTAAYTVTVTDIKETHLPAVDDELAKAVSQYENVAQLRGYIRNTLQQQKEREEDARFTDEVIDAIVNQSEIHYPALMLEDEINQETERSKQLAQRLGLTWDKYLSLSGKNEQEYREEQRPRAEQRLKRLLVMLELMEAEKVEVTSKEVDVEIDRRAEEAAQQGGRADQTRRALSAPSARHDLEFNLKLGKTVDRVVAMAKGEPVSGRIVTPEMVREEERARQQAAAAEQAARSSGGLITDPSQVRSEDWPRGLDRPIIPGEERQNR
jgi:trigger factor